MKAVILNTQNAADTAERLLRKAHGIPHADDSGTADGLVQVGGGGHVPLAQARTVRFAAIIKHPTLTKWAVLLRDRDVTRLMSAKAEELLTTPVLDEGGAVVQPARLTQAEYDTIKTRLAGAVDLPDGWRPQLVR